MLDAKDTNINSFMAKVYTKLAMQVKTISRESHFQFLLFGARYIQWVINLIESPGLTNVP